MSPRLRFWLLCAAILAVDQATKNCVLAWVEPEREIPFLGSYGRIVHVTNSGAAFGLFQGIPGFFLALTSGAVALLVAWRLRAPAEATLYPLAAVLGGAAGNLVDRIRFGHVIDFVDLGVGALRWPAFNVADAAISIGVILLVLLPDESPAPADAA